MKSACRYKPAPASVADMLAGAVLALILLIHCAAIVNAAPEARRPNVVFILLDDLGWSDLGCYGNRFYETPNIDGMAKNGMRFTNAYAACPVCSPTRASILTGKYPARLGLTDWIPGGGAGKNRPLIEAPFQMFLASEEVTLAEVLNSAGYVTASVGKWHLGGKGHLPQDQGFGLNIGGTAAGSPAGGYFLPNKMPLPGARHGEYLTDRLSIDACKFIQTNRDRPFFLYLAHHAVHTPIQGKPALVAKYKAKLKSGEKWNPAYAAMVQSGDESVGRVMATLEENKIADQTVVFFTSDNGGLASVTNNAPLRAGKGHVYEGGIREPMIVVWPGVVEPGSECSEPVSSVDFYRTILEIAGTEGDAPHNRSVDGVSLTPILKGGKSSGRRPLFWHYPHYSPQGGVPASAVRDDDLKLIEFFEDGRLELYNLAEDPGETNNLAGKSPQQATRLHKLLVDWRARVGAKLPTKNPDFRPSRQNANPKR